MKIHNAEHSGNRECWTFTVKTDDGLPIHVHCHMDDPEEVSIGDWGEVDATDDVLDKLHVLIDSRWYDMANLIRAVSIKARRVIEEMMAEEAQKAALEREMKEIAR